MSQEIKLPEELMKEIESVRNQVTENVVYIGRLNVQRSFFLKDVEEIEKQLQVEYDKAETLNGKENELQQKVVSQFGAGKLDFSTGIFTKD
jgi:hypothetical protein